jgi:GDPmannose 4,6-dehydratase
MGVDGQDGSYLAEMLLTKGYQVTGWTPAGVPIIVENIRHLREQLRLVDGDLRDQDGLLACLEESQPDEIYNLAAPSSAPASWGNPILVGDVAGLGVARLLEAVRQVSPKATFFQASSSEMFGIPVESPQNENTPFQPRNPYGISKLYAHWITVRYRQQYGLQACSGIMFNHESPRRGLSFVTRKVTRGAAAIRLGVVGSLALGDLEARRDWGFAGDYVQAMWLMLQNQVADDYVVGTGETHSVRELCELAFGCLDLDYHQHVVVDPSLVRPAEAVQLVADPSKARRQLGWEPSLSFEELVKRMVFSDLEALQQ